MSDKEKKEPIKVTDRRAFTPEGERRSPSSDEPPSPSEPADASTVKGEGFELRRPASSTPLESQQQSSQQAVDFSSFILSLTSTAFIHLGEMEDPVTHKVQVQLEAARQMIDIIDMLHEKTRGNLDPQEEEFVSGILFELKMRYSQRAGTR